MNNTIVCIDVREDIRNGREPFSKIMNAVSQLRADENLLLLAPFEPVPLVHMLKKQGFQHRARSTRSGDWEVLFERRAMAGSEKTNPPKGDKPTRAVRPDASEVVELELRGLEPPLPMIKILETLTTLSSGASLRARTDRRPIHLYPELEARGFTAQTEEQTDGSFLSDIRPR